MKNRQYIYWHASGNKTCGAIQWTEIEWIVLFTLSTTGACWIVLVTHHFVYPQKWTCEFPQDQFVS